VGESRFLLQPGSSTTAHEQPAWATPAGFLFVQSSPVALHSEHAVKPCKRPPPSRGCRSHLIRPAPPRGRLSRTASFSRARVTNTLVAQILAILMILEQWLASWLAVPLHWLPAEALCRRIGNSMINSCSSISTRCISHALVGVRTGFSAFTCTWRFLNTPYITA